MEAPKQLTAKADALRETGAGPKRFTPVPVHNLQAGSQLRLTPQGKAKLLPVTFGYYLVSHLLLWWAGATGPHDDYADRPVSTRSTATFELSPSVCGSSALYQGRTTA